MRGYLENKGWWNQTMDEEFATDIRKEVLLALVRAEKRKKPSIEEVRALLVASNHCCHC